MYRVAIDMDENFTDLGRKISHTVENVLTSQEFANLKQDVRNTMNEVGNVAKDVGKTVWNAANATPKPGSFTSTTVYNSSGTVWRNPVPPPAPPKTQRPVPPQQQVAPPLQTQIQPQAPAEATQFTNFSNPLDKKKNKPKKLPKAPSLFLTAAGILGAFPTASILVNQLFELPFCSSIPEAVITTILSALPLAACCTIASCGLTRLQYIARTRKYQKQLQGLDYVRIDEMAEFFSTTPEKLKKDLKQMVTEHQLETGYFDDQETHFILTERAHEQYLAAKEALEQRKLAEEEQRQLEAADPEQAAVERIRREGEEYLQKMRQINAQLPDPEITKKLDQLESICRQIFKYVTEHPEKLPQIRKFMSYYLPTTLKLTEAYRDLELKSIETQEVKSTKAEIRDALDNVNLAFQNLYQNLMQKDLMGLSADISALETMLVQEGLIQDELQVKPEEPKPIELKITPEELHV